MTKETPTSDETIVYRFRLPKCQATQRSNASLLKRGLFANTVYNELRPFVDREEGADTVEETEPVHIPGA